MGVWCQKGFRQHKAGEGGSVWRLGGGVVMSRKSWAWMGLRWTREGASVDVEARRRQRVELMTVSGIVPGRETILINTGPTNSGPRVD